MPADIPWPECLRCGRPLTFFFQLQFPQEHSWAGKVLAVFHCVECNTAESMYPRFPESPERVLSGFLISYQTNFKLIVFDAAQATVIHTDHEPRIKYQLFKFNPITKDIGYHTKVGGNPVWGAGLVHNTYTYILVGKKKGLFDANGTRISLSSTTGFPASTRRSISRGSATQYKALLHFVRFGRAPLFLRLCQPRAGKGARTGGQVTPASSPPLAKALSN